MIYKSKIAIGEIEIFPIYEMEVGDLIQEITPMATPENIKEIKWLIPRYADCNGKLKGVIQSFLIKSGTNNILVDTCVGNDKPRSYKPWKNANTDFLIKLEELNIASQDINFVISTHLHTDHIGWNTILENGRWVPTFPNAQYIMVKGEYDYWKLNSQEDFNDSVVPIINDGLAKFVDSNYKIDDNISLIPTPGHTSYHVSVLIKSKGQSAIIVGDLFHHPCEINYPEWTTNSEFDKNILINSRKMLLQKIANKSIVFIGSHFSEPYAGKITWENNMFEFK